MAGTPFVSSFTASHNFEQLRGCTRTFRAARVFLQNEMQFYTKTFETITDVISSAQNHEPRSNFPVHLQTAVVESVARKHLQTHELRQLQRESIALKSENTCTVTGSNIRTTWKCIADFVNELLHVTSIERTVPRDDAHTLQLAALTQRLEHVTAHVQMRLLDSAKQQKV